ncbi:unnamed protein product [Mytilus coruscus]|uniref:Tyr recombinase domain-containing protein n=1 Tax=Mytilus coruscus TaxID=42192 RepID=A0A6J8EW59_MYTCO|nr:unnamed protein product [Mytilus coruscus]
MVDELSKIGFKVPTNLTLNVVKTLYTENIGNKNSDARVEAIDYILSATDSFPSDTQTASTETQNRESIDNTSATEMLTQIYWWLLLTLCHNANTAPSIQNTPDALPHGLNRTGVRSDDFPNVYIVSNSITETNNTGYEDINLASLLIPSFESPKSHTILADGMEINVGNKPDPRLNRQLTIQEFIKAFKKFNRVMTSAFPGRRFELDAYEEDIIEISNFYRQKYNYLKENCSDPSELYNGKPFPRLTLILNSVKRSKNQNKRVRLPITFDILEQIIKRLRKGVFSKFIDLMIETASVISFFGFLRYGEITVIKSEQFEPAINLCISDISFKDNVANFHLQQSKTDPFRKGIDIQLHKINSHICPYRVLKRYLEIRKTFMSSYQNTDPLFVSIGNLAMEREFFITKIRHVLELCGYDPKNFSGHSFRIGAGTAAGQANIEDHMIKTLGRWSSDCYVRYIRTQPNSIKHAQQQLAESIYH